MTNLEMNRNIADFIGNYCTIWNLSASKFADKCEIPYMTVKRILSCNVQKIDVFTVVRIAQATKTPLTEILGIGSEYQELQRRLLRASPQDKEFMSDILDILEKLHFSGKECREIPYTDLDYDRTSYILSPHLFCRDGLELNNMQRITFRSCFLSGMNYYGFRLPNHALHPYYQKGSILLVVNMQPQDGDLGAFVWKDQGFIRLIFRRLQVDGALRYLVPINHIGRKYTINTNDHSDLMNWVTLGTVAGIIQ